MLFSSLSYTKQKVLILCTVICVSVGVVLIVWWMVRYSGDEIGVGVLDAIREEELVRTENVEDPFPDDRDRDGIPDMQEQEMGLSDVLVDTDKDGLSDGDEMRIWKTDSLKFDTDGDGYGDGWEVINGYNPDGEGLLPDPVSQ